MVIVEGIGRRTNEFVLLMSQGVPNVIRKIVTYGDCN